MKISIRESKFQNGRKRLVVYRPRERTWSIGADAHETPSGRWIVAINRQPLDVAETQQDARRMLEGHFAGLPE